MPISLTKREERIIIILLTLVQVCHVLDFVIMMPLGPMLIRSLHITSAEFGKLVSAYTISAGFFGILGTFITDRFERKNFMLLLFVGFALGTLYCSFASSYYSLMGARVIAGGFGGLLGATVFAMVGDYIPVERRGSALGLVMTSFPISSVVGVPTGLMIANKFGWQSPFLFLAILSAAFFILSITLLPKVNNQKNLNFEPLTVVKKILFNSSHLNAFFLLQTLMFSIFFLIPYIAPFMVKNIGMTEGELPFIYFFGGALTFITSQLFGRLTDKYGPKNIFLIISWISLTPIILLTHLTARPIYQVIMVTCFFMSFVSGRNVPAMALMLSRVKPEVRGSFMTFTSSFQQLAVGAAAFLGGIILMENESGQITNYHHLGYIAIAASLIGIAIGYFLSLKPSLEG